MMIVLIQTVDSNPACRGRRPTPNLSLSTRCRGLREEPLGGEDCDDEADSSSENKRGLDVERLRSDSDETRWVAWRGVDGGEASFSDPGKG